MFSFFPYIHIPGYKLGPFTLEAFGLLVGIGVIVGSMMTKHRADKLKLDLNLMIDSFFWVVPGGFVIAHWVSLFAYFPERFVQDPLTFFHFWAGISSFGGFLGGFLIATLFFYYRRVPVRPYIEGLAYGFIPGFAIGRIGCTVAHDHPGLLVGNKLTDAMQIAVYKGQPLLMPGWDSPWLWITVIVLALSAGMIASIIREKPFVSLTTFLSSGLFAGFFAIIYPYIPGLLRAFAIPFPMGQFHNHAKEISIRLIWGDFTANVGGKTMEINTRLAYDLGFLEAVYFLFLICGLSLILRTKVRREGTILAVWFITYGPIRFFLDFLRTTDKHYFGLTPGQYMCFITFAIGVYLYATMPQLRFGEYIAPVPKEQKKRPSPPAKLR